ncbi:MAG: penicillin-binding protein 2 [Anaerolineae bacterium]
MSALLPVQSSRRLMWLLALLTAVAIMIVMRLFYWQVMRHDDLQQKLVEDRGQTVVLLARRGDIVSSDGVLLATDIYNYEIAAHPPQIKSPEVLAASLAPILNTTQGELLRLLTQKDSTVMLTRNAPFTVGSQISLLGEKVNLSGIDLNTTSVRRYPNNRLAAHILGFVSGERHGAYGIEQYYDEILSGRPGQTTGESNALRDEMLWFESGSVTSPVDGATLVLTLNSGIQGIAERELATAMNDTKATAGQIIILDANTSAILALASYPAPDLNAYSTTNLKEYEDPAASLLYEPGSVFKVVTLAAGLDSNRINANTSFNDTGSVTVGGRTFYNHDFLHPGQVNLVDVMKMSLNVEACKISMTTGAKSFYQYLHDFGFGSVSGVDVAGELPGVVKNPGDGLWYESDLCSNAFGQGIAVTPLQMANALVTVANGGKLMRPYIVAKIVRPDGSTETRSPVMIRQVLRPETARLVTDILAQSIGTESINQAVVPGYRIAGKTGTAQIPIPGGYDAKWTIASFGGYFPAAHPQYVILVKLDRPTSSEWGSVVASPVFARVAQQLAQLTGLPPDDVRGAGK